jgi:Family of unknown function (DUF5677)
MTKRSGEASGGGKRDARESTFDLDAARTNVRALHGPQLDACDRLREFAFSLSPWPGRPLDPYLRPHEPLLAAIFARSLNTYCSTIELTRIGFGEQAAMLNRSLFEDMIDAHWVTVEPALAVERMRDHHLHGRMLLADAARSQHGFVPHDEIPTFHEAERTRLDGMFGPNGSRSWTTVGLHERVAAVAHIWGERADSLDFHRRIVHRDNNQQLHLSGQAIGEVIVSSGPDGLAVKVGPGPEYIGRALAAAFWTFAEMVGLIVDQFEIPAEDFMVVHAECVSAFRSGPSEAAGA